MEKYIQFFIDVTRNVFEEFLNTKIEADRPYFSDKNTYPHWDISGVIGVTGEATGVFVMSMKKDLAATIAKILTNKTHTGLDDDVVDCVGEIINIISGNVKAHFEEDFKLTISLPTVVCGDNHTIQWPHTNARIICIPFKFLNSDDFHLSLAIEVIPGTPNA
jgi:chemotaxis protein CheX